MSGSSTSSSSNIFRVLVSGSSRGLGFGFVSIYASRPHTHVIATCRDPLTATKLNELRDRHPKSITVLTLDVTDEKSVSALVSSLSTPTSPHYIPSLDVLINNAGIATSNHPDERIANTDAKEMATIYQTNVVGPMVLTRALLPILKSSSSPTVAFVSSNLGSIASNDWGGLPSYRCSKTALNHLTKIFALEEKGVKFVSLHPGWVNTDMGSAKGRKPPVRVEDSVVGMVKQIDGLKEENSGKFIDFKGKELPF